MDPLHHEHLNSSNGFFSIVRSTAEFPDQALDKELSFPSSAQISTIDDHNSRNGCDLSDAALRYIDQILMEEDTDDGAHTLQESSDFPATERSFYEVLGQKYPPSPQQESSHESRFKTPTAPFDGLTDHIVPSNSSIRPSSGLYSIVKHKRSFGESEVLWDFKEGVARVANSVLREGKILHIIGVTIQNPSEGGNKAVKLGEDRARTTKNPPVFTESDILIEEFDKLLLSKLDDRDSKGVQNSVSKARLGKSHKVKKDAIDWSTLLTKCAQMVASGDRQAAADLLTKIRLHSSPNGDWAERLAHYLADGLEAHLAGTGGQVYKALAGERIFAPASLKSYYTSVASFPCLKVTNLVSNKLLAARSTGSACVNIIEFGILHGFQWPTFIRRLALRPGGPPRLRITAVDFPGPGPRPTERMEEMGERLARYARAFGIPFEFSGVAREWESASTANFRVEPGEFLAVSCSHLTKNLRDGSKTAVLDLIRRIGPDVLVHGVVDGAYGSGSPQFPTRFREAFFQFSALFDMVETMSMPGEKADIMLFEGMIRKDIINVVACEGPDRVEWPETRRQWHGRHIQAGFRQVSFGSVLTGSVLRKVKGSGSYHRDFLVEKENQWLLMSWKGRVVFSMSSGSLLKSTTFERNF